MVAQLCALGPDDLDQATVDSVRDVGKALQLDWSAWWHWCPSAIRPPGDPWTSSVETRPAAPFPITVIPSIAARLARGEGCWFSTLHELPESDRAAFSHLGVRSGIVLPVARPDDGDGAATALALGSLTREQRWTPAIIEPLQLLAGVLRQACPPRHVIALRALQDVRQLRDHAAENHELRREVKGLRTSRSIVSGSAAIQAVLAQIDQVAPTPATVLLLGETGTGKDVMAQAIHDLSPRRQRQMIRVSCAAIPTALIESELFGRERGAYTGALSRQIGRFEAASQSTLFLDEIGDLPLEVQVKLLRVLQERVIERLGSTQPIKVDVRIIAATNRNLEDAVRDKAFREDLYYRLNVFPIVVPPLRERVEDIPALVWSFIDEFSQAFARSNRFRKPA